VAQPPLKVKREEGPRQPQPQPAAAAAATTGNERASAAADAGATSTAAAATATSAAAADSDSSGSGVGGGTAAAATADNSSEPTLTIKHVLAAIKHELELPAETKPLEVFKHMSEEYGVDVTGTLKEKLRAAAKELDLFPGW